MNELFEEMKNNYEIFCRSAQRFMDACQEAQQNQQSEQQPVQEKPDYKSWIGKVVYVWDDDPNRKQRAILLDYLSGAPYPFYVAGSCFAHAELCKE